MAKETYLGDRLPQEWVEEGWTVFMEEVLAKNWPDHPAVRTLCEVCFFGGANWVTAVLGEEGLTEDVYEKLRTELSRHADCMREKVKNEQA